MRQLIILAVMGECLIGIYGQSPAFGTVDLCTVATNVKAYNGQQVRVKAFLGAGAEADVLYDPKCQDGKPLVYVSFKPEVTGQMKALRRIVAKKRYALVTIEGTMHGPETVKVDPKLPDWLKELQGLFPTLRSSRLFRNDDRWRRLYQCRTKTTAVDSILRRVPLNVTTNRVTLDAEI